MARTFNDGLDAAIAMHGAEIARLRAAFDQHLTKKAKEGRSVRWKAARFGLLSSIENHQRFVRTLQSLKEAV